VLRRICLVGAVIAAGSLAVGVVTAPAAATKAAAKTKTTVKATAVTCSSNVTTAIPAGDTQVIAPVSDGTQYGAVRCNKGLGSGVQTDTFTTLDTGNLQGLYKLYLNTGTVHGKFNLTPAEGPPLTTGTFQSAFYTGTLTVTGGTGAYLHVKSKGIGTLTCSSPDDVHLSCSDKFKVVKP
jgi:hypothetical protein